MFVNSRKIHIDLDTRSITKAIKELNRYKAELRRKTDEYRKRLASELTSIMEANFRGSLVHTSTTDSRPPEVEVGISNSGDITVVYARGEDAVWVEFGAGVYYNGSVGSSPNPLAANSSTDVTIGSYGLGKGKQQAWGYYQDPDNKTGLTITRGTPAQMPMYHAIEAMLSKSIEIAREVFR